VTAVVERGCHNILKVVGSTHSSLLLFFFSFLHIQLILLQIVLKKKVFDGNWTHISWYIQTSHTTRLVINYSYLLKPFNIYYREVWHPKKLSQDPPLRVMDLGNPNFLLIGVFVRYMHEARAVCIIMRLS